MVRTTRGSELRTTLEARDIELQTMPPAKLGSENRAFEDGWRRTHPEDRIYMHFNTTTSGHSDPTARDLFLDKRTPRSEGPEGKTRVAPISSKEVVMGQRSMARAFPGIPKRY